MRAGRRIVDAVMLVLAGSGCWSSSAPAPVTGPEDRPSDAMSAANQTGSAAGAGSAADTGSAADGAGSATTTTTVVVAHGTGTPAGFDPRAATDPRGFCDDYKRRTKVDARKAQKLAPNANVDLDLDYGDAAPGPRGTTGQFDRVTKTVRCSVVREEVAVQRKATYTPTCCPAGRGNAPCPPTQTLTVTDRKVLLETAVLGGDGTVVSSSLAWQLFPHRFERHNCGRRPEGLVVDGSLGGSAVAAELALMAELEAASVPAFERLARELAHHGAPRELVRRAQAAMRDEVRHARTLGQLATSSGCPPRAIAVPPLPCRELVEIARENAVEGCVREAYGALIATFQAERAAPELRAVFAAIARDERRHAELAEDVHAWITGALDATTHAAVLAERAAAEARLRSGLAASTPCDLLGLPGAADAYALFDAYFASELELLGSGA